MVGYFHKTQISWGYLFVPIEYGKYEVGLPGIGQNIKSLQE